LLSKIRESVGKSAMKKGAEFAGPRNGGQKRTMTEKAGLENDGPNCVHPVCC